MDFSVNKAYLGYKLFFQSRYMSYFYFEQNTVSKTLLILGQCTWSTGNKSYFLSQYDKIR